MRLIAASVRPSPVTVISTPLASARSTRPRPHRHLVHVDQVLAQSADIDLGPVGRGIGLEDAHDLLDGAEGLLAGHGRNSRFAAVNVPGVVHVRAVLGKDQALAAMMAPLPTISSSARLR